MALDVDAWLEDLGLGRYAAQFREHAIDAALLLRLDDEDLKAIGVAALGHRKRLLEAAQALRAQPQAAAGAAAAARGPGLEAERRQLTVAFCELVEPEPAAASADPEEQMQLLGEFHDAVAEAVARFGGYAAQYLAEGLMIYFGYPRAHEDDAVRAVRAALAVGQMLHTRRFCGQRRLQARMGIATGRVVIGEVGEGAAAEPSAVGTTPNLAARLLGIAAPGETVIAEETRALVGGFFELQAREGLVLKGFAAVRRAWQVLGERTGATRFEAQHMQGLVGLVGRDGEMALLAERWALSRGGEGQVVLLSGEAGIGKSRLCQSLRERIATDAAATIVLQCSPYYSRSALYPIARHLELVTGMQPADDAAQRARRLEHFAGHLAPAALGCMLRLLGLPDGGRPRPGGGSPQEEKVHTIEALVQMLHRLAGQQPVLLLVEDAHWIDPSTDAVIARISQQIQDWRLMLLVTCRPEYTPPWGHASQATHHGLGRLPGTHCAALVGALASQQALPPEVTAEIIRKADGIPLFIEEVTRAVLSSGLLSAQSPGPHPAGPLRALQVPATLQDSLMARLDRLAPAKAVAQVGAVIGREFTHRLIADVLADMGSEHVEHGLDELVRAEVVFRRGTAPEASYTFKHALLRDAAYDSLLNQQRTLRHAQIAQALARDPHLAATQPEVLAVHYQEGGQAAAAARCWQQAGDAAMVRSAMPEAVSHYRAALALLPTAPQGPAGGDEELQLQLRLANAVVQAEGYTSPQAQQSYARARVLALALDRPDAHMQACCGMAAALNVAARYSEAEALLDSFDAAALQRLQPMGRLDRLARIGYAKTYRGELEASARLLQAALDELGRVAPAALRPLAGSDPQVALRVWIGQNRMWRGLLDGADAMAGEALELAERGQHSNSLVWALYNHALMADLRGDLATAAASHARARQMAERYGLRAFLGWALGGLGRCEVAAGRVEEGAALLHEGWAAWARYGGRFFGTHLAVQAAEVLLQARRPDLARAFVERGETTQRETEEQFMAASLLALRAGLRAAEGQGPEAAALLWKAVDLAQAQGALLPALQAAMALARLRPQLPADAAAEAPLRQVLHRCSEGAGHPLLLEARALLQVAARA